MINVKTFVILMLSLGLLVACHEDYRGPIYKYTVGCPGHSEPYVFEESREISVQYVQHTTGYIRLEINKRHGGSYSLIEKYEWPDIAGCSISQKLIGHLEPTKTGEK